MIRWRKRKSKSDHQPSPRKNLEMVQDPIPEEKPKLKVRVEPFGQQANYYHILYRLPGGILWQELKICSLRDSPLICTRDHPLLIRDFDEAVEKAKSLTVESIKQHNNYENAKYEEHMRKLREVADKRNRTFEI